MTIFERGLGANLYGDLSRMQREMDRLFGETRRLSQARVYPPINIYDAEDGYHLRAELPGVDPDSLDITVTRNEVVIKGERTRDEGDDEVRYHRRERGLGSFSRAFALPDHLDPDNVQASYKDGVLTLVTPRLPEAGPRKVAVLSA